MNPHAAPDRNSLSLPQRKWLVPFTFVALLIATPFVVRGVVLVESNTTDMKQWLPDGRDEVQKYQQFVDQFGVDDTVVLTWEGCTIDDQRVGQLAVALRAESAKQDPLWRQVTTGPELLDELPDPRRDLTRRLVKRRLSGLLLGDDQQTCLLISLTATGRSQPHQVVDSVRQHALSACDLGSDELMLAGSVYKVAMIDQESERSVRNCVVPSCLLAILVALIVLRSLRLTVAVLVTAAFCAAMSVALIYYCHTGLNAILIVVPTLVFVLTVSGAVHLANYYRDAKRETGMGCAVQQALRVGWVPCTMAAASTAVGLASLTVSDLSPIRNFGLFTSVSVLLSLAVLLALFYATLRVWPERSSNDQPTPTATSASARVLDALATAIIRWANPCTLICLALLAAAAFGLGRTTATVDLFRNFRSRHELIRNYESIERLIGPQAAIEVVVHFPSDCDWPLLQRMEQLNKVRLLCMKDFGPTLSATTFAPPIPDRAVGRAAYKTKMERQRQQLVDAGWLAETENAELWRIHVRVPELSQPDYKSVIARLNTTIKPLFAEDERIAITYTGGCPLIDEAQHVLLDDLLKSFLLAFLVLCPVIMVAVRGVWSGLITMIPNVVPVVAVFGVMGWMGIPIEIGTVVTASVALGIAVDDTLHFLTWFRRSIEAGETRERAILTAYRRCAPAMIQTTLICTSGMLLLIPATFVPASQFAVLLIVLLLMALAGDLILLPAVLASPLGLAFFRKEFRKSVILKSPQETPQ